MRTSKMSAAQSPVEQLRTQELPKVTEQDRQITKEDGDGKALLTTDCRYWEPFFLSSSAALGFSITYAAIIIGLALLYTHSKAHNGIATTNNNLHYLWAFGTTTLATVILVYWGLLDYRIRPSFSLHGMPWPGTPLLLATAYF